MARRVVALHEALKARAHGNMHSRMPSYAHPNTRPRARAICITVCDLCTCECRPRSSRASATRARCGPRMRECIPACGHVHIRLRRWTCCGERGARCASGAAACVCVCVCVCTCVCVCARARDGCLLVIRATNRTGAYGGAYARMRECMSTSRDCRRTSDDEGRISGMEERLVGLQVCARMSICISACARMSICIPVRACRATLFKNRKCRMCWRRSICNALPCAPLMWLIDIRMRPRMAVYIPMCGHVRIRICRGAAQTDLRLRDAEIVRLQSAAVAAAAGGGVRAAAGAFSDALVPGRAGLGGGFGELAPRGAPPGGSGGGGDGGGGGASHAELLARAAASDATVVAQVCARAWQCAFLNAVLLLMPIRVRSRCRCAYLNAPRSCSRSGSWRGRCRSCRCAPA